MHDGRRGAGARPKGTQTDLGTDCARPSTAQQEAIARLQNETIFTTLFEAHRCQLPTGNQSSSVLGFTTTTWKKFSRSRTCHGDSHYHVSHPTGGLPMGGWSVLEGPLREAAVTGERAVA